MKTPFDQVSHFWLDWGVRGGEERRPRTSQQFMLVKLLRREVKFTLKGTGIEFY